jgi:hypothetical protein
MVAMAAPKPANFGISKNDKISLAIAAMRYAISISEVFLFE